MARKTIRTIVLEAGLAENMFNLAGLAVRNETVEMSSSIGVETVEWHLVVERYHDRVHVVSYIALRILYYGIPVNG